jgi:hypothetical protein
MGRRTIDERRAKTEERAAAASIGQQRGVFEQIADQMEDDGHVSG